VIVERIAPSIEDGLPPVTRPITLLIGPAPPVEVNVALSGTGV